MNKTQLVEAVTARIGDRRTALAAVDGVLETIVRTVGAGESVSLTGFGVFESRARAARIARNPRTGEVVAVPATTVPAFRPGAGFRAVVAGASAPPAPANLPGSAFEPESADAPAEAPRNGSSRPVRARRAAVSVAAVGVDPADEEADDAVDDVAEAVQAAPVVDPGPSGGARADTSFAADGPAAEAAPKPAKAKKGKPATKPKSAAPATKPIAKPAKAGKATKVPNGPKATNATKAPKAPKAAVKSGKGKKGK